MAKILVVEDFPDLVKLYKIVIEKNGHECVVVDTVDGVRELAGAIARREFSAVILDNNLKGGEKCFPEVAEWLRDQDPGLQIALNSAGSNAKEEEEVEELSKRINATNVAKDSGKMCAFIRLLSS